MYLITWIDTRTGQQKDLKVSTARAVADVTATLNRDSYFAKDVRVSRVSQARRLREIVISFER